MTKLEEMKTTELRNLAREGGLKGMSSARKEDLLKALAPLYPDREEKPAPARKNRCEICKIRSRMPAARMQRVHGVEFPYCEPCLIEADWENVHNDDGHQTGTVGDVEGCWICFPGLNRASAEYVSRAGTSRVGMVMNVRRSQTAMEKAETVRAALKGRKISAMIDAGGQATVGLLTLTVTGPGVTVTLAWDARGRYVYTASTLATPDGKRRKIRNVSEALKIFS